MEQFQAINSHDPVATEVEQPERAGAGASRPRRLARYGFGCAGL